MSEFPSEDDPEPSDSRHILEAFFHVHFMLEMAVRYSSLECKYCGTNAPTIRALTLGSCPRHPDGKGRHSPAL